MKHYDWQGKSIFVKTKEGDILGIHATGQFDDDGNWHEMEAWLNQYDAAETFQGSIARLQTPIEECVKEFLADGCTIIRREDPKFEYTPYISSVSIKSLIEEGDYQANCKYLVEQLKTTGFLIIHRHDISSAVFDVFYAEWKKFFELEQSLKNFYKFSANNQVGYYPNGSEKAKDATIPDLKEFYHYYPDRAVDHTNGITQYLQFQLNKLGSKILEMIQIGLPEDVKAKMYLALPDMIAASTQTLFRILHYPPNSEIPEGAVRAAAHEDINLITLLPMATGS